MGGSSQLETQRRGVLGMEQCPVGHLPDTGLASRQMLAVLQGSVQSVSARLLVSFYLWAQKIIAFFAFS